MINKFEAVLNSSTVLKYSLWAHSQSRSIEGSKSPLMLITNPLGIIGILRNQKLSGIRQSRINKKVNIILENIQKGILSNNPIKIIIFSWFSIINYVGFLT